MFISVLMNTFNCNITNEMSCESAYNLYVLCFNKTKSQSRQNQFCLSFEELISIKPSCESCGITSVMDIRRDLLYNIGEDSNVKSLKAITKYDRCQWYYCYAMLTEAESPTLSKVYTSVHLYEAGVVTLPKDQVDYGVTECSWAFSTITILENMILLTKNQLDSFWQSQIPNLHLSEAFIAINVQGINQYNFTGFFDSAMSYMNDEPTFTTVELESNYPYTNFASYTAGYPSKLPSKPSTTLLKPFRVWTTGQYDNNGLVSAATPTISIVNYSTLTAVLTITDIKRIKSYLSKGVAISSYLDASAPVFTNYDGSSYAEASCLKGTRNHIVTIVGYGTFKDKEVWVVQNSWGTNWGANGYIYIPIGANNFCMEALMHTAVAKGFSLSSALKSIGSQARGGNKQLMPDTGGLEDNTGNIQQPMKQFKYLLQTSGNPYSGTFTAIVKGSDQKIILSTQSATVSGQVRGNKFPLSIIVTDTVGNVVFSQQAITLQQLQQAFDIQPKPQLIASFTVSDDLTMLVSGLLITTTLGTQTVPISSFYKGSTTLLTSCDASENDYQVIVSGCGLSLQKTCKCGQSCAFTTLSATFTNCAFKATTFYVSKSQNFKIVGKIMDSFKLYDTTLLPSASLDQSIVSDVSELIVTLCYGTCVQSIGGVNLQKYIYERDATKYITGSFPPNLRFYCTSGAQTVSGASSGKVLNGASVLYQTSAAYGYFLISAFPVTIQMKVLGFAAASVTVSQPDQSVEIPLISQTVAVFTVTIGQSSAKKYTGMSVTAVNQNVNEVLGPLPFVDSKVTLSSQCFVGDTYNVAVSVKNCNVNGAVVCACDAPCELLDASGFDKCVLISVNAIITATTAPAEVGTVILQQQVYDCDILPQFDAALFNTASLSEFTAYEVYYCSNTQGVSCVFAVGNVANKLFVHELTLSKYTTKKQPNLMFYFLTPLGINYIAASSLTLNDSTKKISTIPLTIGYGLIWVDPAVLPIILSLKTSEYQLFQTNITSISALALKFQLNASVPSRYFASLQTVSGSNLTGFYVGKTTPTKTSGMSSLSATSQTYFWDGAATLDACQTVDGYTSVSVQLPCSTTGTITQECLCGQVCMFQWSDIDLCGEQSMKVVVAATNIPANIGQTLLDLTIYPSPSIPAAIVDPADINKTGATSLSVYYCADKCFVQTVQAYKLQSMSWDLAQFTPTNAPPNAKYYLMLKNGSTVVGTVAVTVGTDVYNATAGSVYVANFPVNVTVTAVGCITYVLLNAVAADLQPLVVVLETQPVFNFWILVGAAGGLFVVFTAVISAVICEKVKQKKIAAYNAAAALYAPKAEEEVRPATEALALEAPVVQDVQNLHLPAESNGSEVQVKKGKKKGLKGFKTKPLLS